MIRPGISGADLSLFVIGENCKELKEDEKRD